MIPDIVITYGFVHLSMSRVAANEMNDERRAISKAGKAETKSITLVPSPSTKIDGEHEKAV